MKIEESYTVLSEFIKEYVIVPQIPILSVKVREVMVIAGFLILYSSDWERAGVIIVVSQ